MSDDLVKRLYDRIEELEAKLEGKAQDLTECAVCVYELEAKLAKGVEALEFYATHGSDDNGRHARTTLAELR